MERSNYATKSLKFLATATLIITLTACLEEDRFDTAAGLTSIDGFNTSNDLSATGENLPPRIAGKPNFLAEIGSSYSFHPTASDPNNDRLSFSIRNKPSWASFDVKTGELSGVPSDGDSSLTSNIVISVSDGAVGDTLAPFSIQVRPPSKILDPSGYNGEPPEIIGNPASHATVAQPYRFRPTAYDPDGGRLRFAVGNRPAWLSFDETTGELSGTPRAQDIGFYGGISITVSDGIFSRTLGPFSLNVVAQGNLNVTLSWQAPTQNEDGSPLQDLSGYWIHYGTSAGAYSNVVDINNPGVTTFGIDGLIPTTYYFVISAYNSEGFQSEFSNETSAVLN